jgi:hypothetical protein
LFKRSRTGEHCARNSHARDHGGLCVEEAFGRCHVRPTLGGQAIDACSTRSIGHGHARRRITITANSDAQAAALLRTIGRED